MKLDLTIIKNESVDKFEKALKSVKNKFGDMLAIALDATIHELNQENRVQVEIAVDDLLNDLFSQFKFQLIGTLNKADDVIQSGMEK